MARSASRCKKSSSAGFATAHACSSSTAQPAGAAILAEEERRVGALPAVVDQAAHHAVIAKRVVRITAVGRLADQEEERQ